MKSDIVRKTQNNIRNIVIGFFLLVFVMGFFSKSIINLFLPKVAVEAALDGMVERTLSIEGRVEAKNTIKVRLPGEAIIAEFFVNNGEPVEIGKPLFRIDKSYGLRGGTADIERLRLQIEAEELRIGNQNGESNQIPLKNLEAMKESLEKSKEQLAGQQTLFDAGAISRQELEGYKETVQQQELAIEIAKLQLEEQGKQALASVKEAESRIESLKLELSELEGKQNFYDVVDEDGICYSKVSGIIAGLSPVQSMLPMDTVVIEIAETGDNAAIIYSAEIGQQDYELVKEAGSIQINSEDIKTSEFLDITSIYEQKDGYTYRVEAAIDSTKTEEFSLGQKLMGIVKQKYVIQGHNKVPKSAVIVYGEYKEGSKGLVYLLEEKEGVLGKEFLAKEVPVKILAAGDNDVIVSGLEGYEKPEVILNLSYKIRDGVKVFLWQ